MLIGIPDKVLVPWLGRKKYIVCSDEGEAIGIGVGYFLATGKPATVFMSADGFMNALNPITSLVVPYNIKMKVVISFGRHEAQHILASELLEDIIRLIRKKNKNAAKTLIVELIRKES